MPATDIMFSTLNTTACGSFVKHVHFAVKMPGGGLRLAAGRTLENKSPRRSVVQLEEGKPAPLAVKIATSCRPRREAA